MLVRRSTSAAVAALALATHATLAGPLNPPAGPVTPTLKTLDQIEPRRIINELPGDADAVHIISEPGVYYLTADVMGEAGKHGIDVRLPSGSYGAVVISGERYVLNGVAGSLNAINIVSTVPGEPINAPGLVCKFGIAGPWDDGVHIESLPAADLSHLIITGCNSDAVEIDNSAITGPLTPNRKFLCQWITATNIGGSGVRVIDTEIADLQDCTITDAGSDGIEIDNTALAGTVNPEVIVAKVSRITMARTAGGGADISYIGTCDAQGVSIASTGGNGFSVDQAEAVTLTKVNVHNAGADACRVTNVSSFGISEEGVKITAPIGNGLVVEDCDAATLANLTVTNAGADACRVIRVSSFGISEEGVKITAPTGNGLVVEDCSFTTLANVDITGGNNGIDITRIASMAYFKHTLEKCKVSSVANTGITITGADDVLISQSSVSNAGGFGIAANNCTKGTHFKEVEVHFCGTPGTGGGISVSDVPTVVIANAIVNDNMNDGLRVVNANSLSISGLGAVSNAAYGVTIDTVELCVGYQDNYLLSNGTGGAAGGGIWANDVSSLALIGTVIDENLGDGLLVTASAAGTPSVTLKKKKIRKNTGRGIAIDVGSGSITDCDLVANGNYGIETGAGFSGSITNNRLVDNAGPILVNGFGCNVTANAATAGPLGFISVPVPGNVVGPIVDETNVGTSGSPFANIMH